MKMMAGYDMKQREELYRMNDLPGRLEDSLLTYNFKLLAMTGVLTAKSSNARGM